MISFKAPSPSSRAPCRSVGRGAIGDCGSSTCRRHNGGEGTIQSLQSSEHDRPKADRGDELISPSCHKPNVSYKRCDGLAKRPMEKRPCVERLLRPAFWHLPSRDVQRQAIKAPMEADLITMNRTTSALLRLFITVAALAITISLVTLVTIAKVILATVRVIQPTVPGIQDTNRAMAVQDNHTAQAVERLPQRDRGLAARLRSAPGLCPPREGPLRLLATIVRSSRAAIVETARLNLRTPAPHQCGAGVHANQAAAG
jgi:hypothetical protein